MTVNTSLILFFCHPQLLKLPNADSFSVSFLPLDRIPHCHCLVMRLWPFYQTTGNQFHIHLRQSVCSFHLSPSIYSYTITTRRSWNTNKANTYRKSVSYSPKAKFMQFSPFSFSPNQNICSYYCNTIWKHERSKYKVNAILTSGSVLTGDEIASRPQVKVHSGVC